MSYHNDSVSTVSLIDPEKEDKYVISGGYDKSVNILDFYTGEKINTYSHNNVLFNTSEMEYKDKGYIISFGKEDIIYSSKEIILDSSNKRDNISISLKNNSENSIQTIANNSKYFVIGYDNGDLSMWDLFPKSNKIHDLIGHQKTINIIYMNEEYIVSAGEDNFIFVWDIELGILLSRLPTLIWCTWALVFNNRYLVSGGEDNEFNRIEVWNFSDNSEDFLKLKHKFSLPEKNEVMTIDIISSENENFIISGGLDGKIIIYDLETLESKIIIDNFLLGKIWTLKISKIDNCNFIIIGSDNSINNFDDRSEGKVTLLYNEIQILEKINLNFEIIFSNFLLSFYKSNILNYDILEIIKKYLLKFYLSKYSIKYKNYIDNIENKNIKTNKNEFKILWSK